MDIPFEQILPAALMKLRPEMRQVPEGHRMIQEALGNRSLDYEQRGQLLHEGETALSDAQDKMQMWRAGQGAIAGGLIAGAVTQAGSLVGQLGAELDKARHNAAIRDMTIAMGSLPGVPRQRAHQMLTNRVLAMTGMLPGGLTNFTRMRGTAIPDKLMTVREMVYGPLMAREGNIERAIQDMGRLVGEVAEKDFGVKTHKVPELSRALRTASTDQSLWGQISRKSARLMRAASNVTLKPSVRLALAAAAVGGGAYKGYTTAGPEIEPRSAQESAEFLRQRDQAIARGGAPPMPPDIAAPVSTAQRQVMRLRNPKLNAEMLDLIVGNPLNVADMVGSAKDHNWGKGWESLGS